MVIVDDVVDTVSTTCSYAGLLGNATAAHIHAPAPPGMNAGVIIPLSPTGGTSGTINNLGVGTSQANIDHILAGNAYVNIHTQTFPGGEIRGQIVPEPGILGWVLVVCLAALRRRK